MAIFDLDAYLLHSYFARSMTHYCRAKITIEIKLSYKFKYYGDLLPD